MAAHIFGKPYIHATDVKMIEYSDSEFEKKLTHLHESQKAIQSLATWCLKRHEHYKSIITIWSKVIGKVEIEKRLTLFYLANHVLQNGKKKKYKFTDGWATAIQNAIPYVKDEKIQLKMLRLFKIWKDRHVFDHGYLANLNVLLTTLTQKLELADPVQELQVHALAVELHSCVGLEQKTDSKIKHLKESNLLLKYKEATQNMFKVQTLSYELLQKLKAGMLKIETYTKCLQGESIDCAQLKDLLEFASDYYKDQNGIVKAVTRAYFNYIERVKDLKCNLETLVGSLPTDSPIPSPDINAPSPSTSFESIEELNLHGINHYDTMLNSDKYMKNSSMENSINDTESQDQQSFTSQFPYDVPSPPPDETFAYPTFPNQINMNNHNESFIYSTSSYKAYVPPMSSSHNMVLPTSSSSLINENIIPVSPISQSAWDLTVHNDWSTKDTLASTPLYQNPPIISKTDACPRFDHCAIASKIIDRDEQVSKEMITYTSDVNHKNVISLTHPPQMNSSMVSDDVDNQPYLGIPFPPPAPAMLSAALCTFYKPPEENLECVDMEMSDDDEESKSNHDQKHAVVPLPPPPLPPQSLMSFDSNQQQSVQDVTKQWQPPFQPWSKDTPSFNERQWNVHQSDQWKHLNQWEHAQCASNFVYNQFQLQQPQHVQKCQPKEDFKPKCKKRIIYNCTKGLGNVIPHSSSTGNWNRGPHFGPRNQPG